MKFKIRGPHPIKTQMAQVCRKKKIIYTISSKNSTMQGKCTYSYKNINSSESKDTFFENQNKIMGNTHGQHSNNILNIRKNLLKDNSGQVKKNDSLVVKIDDDINKIVILIRKILESRKYANIYLKLSGREFKRNTDFSFFTETLLGCRGYMFIIACLPKINLDENEFCSFYEIRRVDSGKFFG